jgi:phosphoribosylaminoimidazolecarboxamide formyltransferase/IMP cyclohydrolase
VKKFSLSFFNQKQLRYGENPRQKGWVWQEKTKDSLAFFKFKQIQGKQLSFNNYLDIDAAVNCLCFIGQKVPACVVIKHTNPCGASTDKDIKKAFVKAWQGDSLAAFGSIIAVNRKVDGKLAKLMLQNRRFFEVLLCPNINAKAKRVFALKKNLRVLTNLALRKPRPNRNLDFKKIRGGLLVQNSDIYQLKAKDLKIVTKKKPTKKQLADLLFAWNIARTSKANAIVLVKNQQLVGSGVGQQDRFRCCQLAVNKSDRRAKNSAAASDAFFPFADGPEILIKAGVKAIIQPGGSIRDQETIDTCNKNNIAMIFTGIRCFRH